MSSPLTGLKVLSLAPNLPGPAAAARLRDLGAAVTKLEAPGGDPMAGHNPALYASLAAGMDVRSCDLKSAAGKTELEALLAVSDLLLTSSRVSALARLGLTPERLAADFSALCWVAVVGHPSPHGDRPGHDLTYQAEAGLIDGAMPTSLLADMAGAAMASEAALALLLGRSLGHTGRYREVSLAGAAEYLALPRTFGLTAPGGLLAGRLPEYRLYRAADGLLAVAALEPHFAAKLTGLLGDDLEAVFLTRSAAEWQAWAGEHDLPLVAVTGHSG